MEKGVNVSNKNVRGARSYPRLNNLRQRMTQVMKMLQERGYNDTLKIKEEKITDLFNDIRNGKIKTIKGDKYFKLLILD